MVMSQAPFHEVLLYSLGIRTKADGRSHPFDDRGVGYSPLVLKRLDRTVSGHDYIPTVIQGPSEGQDGKASSICLPNSSAQEALARSVAFR
jgi:acyl transferase domain-containing protein